MTTETGYHPFLPPPLNIVAVTFAPIRDAHKSSSPITLSHRCACLISPKRV